MEGFELEMDKTDQNKNVSSEKKIGFKDQVCIGSGSIGFGQRFVERVLR